MDVKIGSRLCVRRMRGLQTFDDSELSGPEGNTFSVVAVTHGQLLLVVVGRKKSEESDYTRPGGRNVIGTRAVDCRLIRNALREGGTAIVEGFGAGDCTRGCPAHLLWMGKDLGLVDAEGRQDIVEHVHVDMKTVHNNPFGS